MNRDTAPTFPARHWTARALGAAERRAPDLAARVAEWLWWRIPTPPPPARRNRHVHERGQSLRVRPDGLDLAVHVFGAPDAPTAYLVHGWGGWWQQFASVVPVLVDAGYRVVAYDAPSHGASGPGRYGASTRVMEMARAHELVVERFGPSHLTLAHSVGAMAVMWAHESGTPARAFLLYSPAVRTEPMIEFLGRAVGAGPRTIQRLGARIERTLGRSLRDFDVTDMLGRLDPRDPPPMLAVHDRGDVQTLARDTDELVRGWPGSRLMLRDGSGHAGVLRDGEVLAATRRFAEAVHPAGSPRRTTDRVTMPPSPRQLAEMGVSSSGLRRQDAWETPGPSERSAR